MNSYPFAQSLLNSIFKYSQCSTHSLTKSVISFRATKHLIGTKMNYAAYFIQTQGERSVQRSFTSSRAILISIMHTLTHFEWKNRISIISIFSDSSFHFFIAGGHTCGRNTKTHNRDYKHAVLSFDLVRDSGKYCITFHETVYCFLSISISRLPVPLQPLALFQTNLIDRKW